MQQNLWAHFNTSLRAQYTVATVLPVNVWYFINRQEVGIFHFLCDIFAFQLLSNRRNNTFKSNKNKKFRKNKHKQLLANKLVLVLNQITAVSPCSAQKCLSDRVGTCLVWAEVNSYHIRKILIHHCYKIITNIINIHITDHSVLTNHNINMFDRTLNNDNSITVKGLFWVIRLQSSSVPVLGEDKWDVCLFLKIISNNNMYYYRLKDSKVV